MRAGAVQNFKINEDCQLAGGVVRVKLPTGLIEERLVMQSLRKEDGSPRLQTYLNISKSEKP